MSALVFPTGFLGLQFVQQRTPLWNTRVQAALSGKETRINLRSSPLMQFELGFEFLRDDIAVSDVKRIVGFFNSVQGAYDTFLYSDPHFNAVTAMQFATGDGSTRVFQVTATYKDSTGYGWPEIVQNFNGNPLIYVNGSVQTAPTNYSISSTGVVTFVSAPAAADVLTWTGSFYYRCRFLDDSLDVSEFLNKWWQMKKLSFQSVKL